MSDFPEQAYVRQFLVDRFSLAELQDLAFDLSVDYEDLPHGTKSEFCRELIAFFERRGNLACLLIEVIKRRDDATISQLLAHFQGCTPRRKVQIILPGDKLVNKPDLLGALAQLLGVRTDEVQLIATAPGSIKLLLGVPGNVADWLLKADVAAFLVEYGYRVLTVKVFESLVASEQIGWKQTTLKIWSARLGQPQFGLTPRPTQDIYSPARPSVSPPAPSYQPELQPPPQLIRPRPLASARRGSGVIALFGTFLALVLVVGVGLIAFLASQPGDYTPTGVVAVSPTPLQTTTIDVATTLTTVTTASVLPTVTGLPTSTPTITPTSTPPPISAVFISPKNQSQLSAETAVQLEIKGPVEHINLIAELPADPTRNIAAQTLSLAVLKSTSNWRFIWLTSKISPQTGITLTAQACFGTDNTHCVEVAPVTNLTIAPPTALFTIPLANTTGGFNSTLSIAATVRGFANHINYTLQYFNPTLFIRNPPAPVKGKLTAATKWASTISLPEGSYNISGEVCWSSDDSICYEMPKVVSVFVSSNGPLR